MNVMLIGRRIRAARISTGYNDPADFAKELRVPQDRYLALEAGRLEERDLELPLLAEIARLTDKSLDFLVYGGKAS